MKIAPNIISGKGPIFKEKIYITRPNLPNMAELSPYLEEMLKKRWVTNFGRFHNELEDRLRKFFGVKHVLLCCNGTIGLFLLLKALDLKGRVITTPFTFPATIHAISMAGCEPLFCDIDPDDYVISAESVESRIDSTVSAILAVNVFGNIADAERLESIGSEHGIPVIYDSAHSFATTYKGRLSGSFGKAEMFSFHATKLFTTLEGGAITTNDDRLFNRLKLMINFGIKDEEHVVDVGLNGKMAELNAIFGLLALDKVRSIVDKLSRLAILYRERLKSIPGIKLQKIREGCVPNNQYMAIEIVPEDFGLDRDGLYEALKADNVYARKYFFPAGQDYACYEDMDFVRSADLPNTRKVAARVLCLPIYNSLEMSDAEKICDLLESIHHHRAAVEETINKGV